MSETTRLREPPAGFRPLQPDHGFTDYVGPYYVRRVEPGFEFGFWSDRRHINTNGVFHGGALLTFMDTIIGYAVVLELKRPCATVAFESKFIAGVPPGNWIRGETRIRSMTRTLAFTDGAAYDGDKLLMTASGVFKIFEPRS